MGKSVKNKKKNKLNANGGERPVAHSAQVPTAENPMKVRVFEAGVEEPQGERIEVADRDDVADLGTKSTEVESVEAEESIAVAVSDSDDDKVEEAEKPEEKPQVAEMKALSVGGAAESGVEITKVQKPVRKSMSGMVLEVVEHPETGVSKDVGADKETEKDDTKDETKAAEATDADRAGGVVGEPRFSQAKSVLIGVAVAVAVAVVGFIGIGIFSGDQRKCTVLFDSNGGTTVNGAEIVCGKAVMEPEAPTKEGFSFQGWLLEGDLFDFSKMTVYNNSVLVARWAADEGTETVKVRFDTAGGSAMNDIELAKGATLSEPVRRPTRGGYTFEGWYLGNARYEFGRPVEADLTLTARWVKVRTPSNNTGTGGGSSENNQGTGNETPDEPEEVKVVELAVSNVEREAESGAFEVAVGVFPGDAAYELEVAGGNAAASCSVKGNNILACTANEAGEATITVKDKKSGVETSFKITVKAKVVESTGVTINGVNSVDVGGTITLTAVITPEGATGELEWSSSDTSKATVVGGTVTGAAEGEVTITVKIKDTDYTASFKVMVVAKEESGGDDEVDQPGPE